MDSGGLDKMASQASAAPPATPQVEVTWPAGLQGGSQEKRCDAAEQHRAMSDQEPQVRFWHDGTAQADQTSRADTPTSASGGMIATMTSAALMK